MINLSQVRLRSLDWSFVHVSVPFLTVRVYAPGDSASQSPVNHDAKLPKRVLVTADDPDSTAAGHTLRFHCCCCYRPRRERRDHATIAAVASSEGALAGDIPSVVTLTQQESINKAARRASWAAQGNLPCEGILRALQFLCSRTTPIVSVPHSLFPPRVSQPRSGVASFGSWIQTMQSSIPSVMDYEALWRNVANLPTGLKIGPVMLRNVIFWQVAGSSYGAITMMKERANSQRMVSLRSECKHVQPDTHGIFCPQSLQVLADLVSGRHHVPVCVHFETGKLPRADSLMWPALSSM